MIVKPKTLGFWMLTFDCRGSVVPAIMPKIILAVLIGIFACLALTNNLFGAELAIQFEPFTALGVAISLFLGFHNNASYARWWEARILWGRQIIVTRDLTRFLLGTMDADIGMDMERSTREEHERVRQTIIKDERERERERDHDEEMDIHSKLTESEEWSGSIFQTTLPNSNTNDPTSPYPSWQAHIVYLAVAHTHAFRHQMRPVCKSDGTVSAMQDRNRFLTADERKELLVCKNPANSILLKAAKILGKAHRNKQIDTFSMIHVQNIVDGMCDIQTACERISNTSLPVAYSLLVHRTSLLYVIFAPFALAPVVGWWTPLFTAMLAYTFFGLDELAKEIQEPFKDRPMCLALSAMCRTIEIDCLEALGKETPEFLKPRGNVLM